MNIQIFGKSKSFDTKKAELYSTLFEITLSLFGVKIL